MSALWEKNIRRVEPYVPGEQPSDHNVIKLNTNENPYPPAPAVGRVLREFDIDRLKKYPAPDAGVLVKALSDHYGISDDKIFVGVGSDDVLAMSFLTFFNSDEPILMADITYSFYDVWANLFKIPYRMIPLKNDFHYDIAEYKKPNGGIVIANPNAPTSVSESEAFFAEIAEANPGSVVIIDEAYSDFNEESMRGLVDRFENVLVVGTFSKSRSLAGSRIGFAFGSPKLIGYLNDVKFSFNSYTMDAITLQIGAAALSAESKTYYDEITAKIIATRERSKHRLADLGFTFPDSRTNFLFVQHEKLKADFIFKKLKENKIFVRYFNKPGIDNYLRITVGTDGEMDRLFEVLEEIGCRR